MELIETKVKEKVKELIAKGYTSSTIGHILRDSYHLKIKKLTRYFPELNQVKEEKEALSMKLRRLELHLRNNKKDYPSKRSYDRLKVKYFNLK